MFKNIFKVFSRIKSHASVKIVKNVKNIIRVGSNIGIIVRTLSNMRTMVKFVSKVNTFVNPKLLFGGLIFSGTVCNLAYGCYIENKYANIINNLSTETTAKEIEKAYFSLPNYKKRDFYKHLRDLDICATRIYAMKISKKMWNDILKNNEDWHLHVSIPHEMDDKIKNSVKKYPYLIHEIANPSMEDLQYAHNAGVHLSVGHVVKLFNHKNNLAGSEKYKAIHELFYIMPKKVRDKKKKMMIIQLKLSRDIFVLKDYVMSGEDLTDIIDKSGISIDFKKNLPSSLLSNGYKYSNGINVDTKEFDPICDCCSGGIYFTDEKHIQNYNMYGPITAQVSIVKSPTVFYKIESQKLKGTSVNLMF